MPQEIRSKLYIVFRFLYFDSQFSFEWPASSKIAHHRAILNTFSLGWRLERPFNKNLK